MNEKISKDFLNVLCCPKRLCLGDLNQEGDELVCKLCGDKYPIHKGIPILFPNNHLSEDTHKRHWDLEGNAKSYAKKYNNYLKKQGSSWGLYTHESELLAIRKLTKGIDLKDKTVLDLGCGNGRLLTEYSEAKTKIGLDASLHLLVAAKEREPNFWFVCAQLEDLPFKDAVADFSISIRVYQHLRAPEEAFEEMVRVTKPSGYVSVENYNKFNLKEIYKRFRMWKPLAKRWNWGLAYDDYNSFLEIKNWSKNNFVRPIRFVGAGWGFYFYIFEFFQFRRFTPESVQRIIYNFFFAIEKIVHTIPPFSHTMEKICFIGSVQSGPKFKKSPFEKIIDRIKRKSYKKRVNKKIKRFENRNYAFAGDNLYHLEKTIEWIISAQENTADSGVSRGFSLIPQDKANKKGWQPSYPETTGYIIPTLFEASKILKNKILRNRALAMADWEKNIQLKDGSIQGGNLSEKPKGAIFDSGQVIRGFIAAWKESGDEKYKRAAERAANWIMKSEDKGGVWTENNALSVNQFLTTYNIYATAPIAELGQKTNNEQYLALAKRVAEHTLSMQEQNGWFKDCDFKDPENPLLHTIAYTIDGLFDIGTILNEEKYCHAAIISLEAVLKTMAENGELAGRFNRDWQKASSWSCLTGMAQIGVTSMKVYKKTGNKYYLSSAEKIIDYLKARQNVSDKSLAPLGSIWGSWPIDGAYGHYQALNWAAKYFADLLIENIKSTKSQSNSAE
ncbi:methyltransferase domain-containing protein [Candidatus Falkowbacteria bacterium]|nr:methyltransferase domain-containing protein [Candidatus Falkowbacteria bacterium]